MQIGSYFGGVITTIDINRDSFTDLLLVGAPTYMGTEKEEQGKVYVYGLNKVRMAFIDQEQNMLLTVFISLFQRNMIS